MRGASSQLIEVKLPNLQYFDPYCHRVLPYPETIVKLQEKYWKLARNGPKSMVGFWESFYEDRIYPSREELAAAGEIMG
jgi:hypothetical protein